MVLFIVLRGINMKKKIRLIRVFFFQWSQVGFWHALNNLIYNFQIEKSLPFSPERERVEQRWKERNKMIHEYYADLLSRK